MFTTVPHVYDKSKFSIYIKGWTQIFLNHFATILVHFYQTESDMQPRLILCFIVYKDYVLSFLWKAFIHMIDCTYTNTKNHFSK